MKCYQAKAGQLNPQWFVIDATDMVVGRLAAQIAPILMGKHRPTYTPHIDTGDYVIVTNVDKVVFTGNKWQQKSYQRYSGYPGGQKEEQAWKLFKRRPARILELAIQRMMPKNKIGRHMQMKLKLYVGAQHPHQAQAPIPLTPIHGRPAAAGALYVPEPTPKAARPRRSTDDSATPAPPELQLPPPAIEPAAPVPMTDVTPPEPAMIATEPSSAPEDMAPEPRPTSDQAPEPPHNPETPPSVE